MLHSVGWADASALKAWWQRRQLRYPADPCRVNFTANHDSNNWHSSCQACHGTLDCFNAMAVLAATLPGMPLVYGGQEGFCDKWLASIERDPIAWLGHPLGAFHGQLLALKRQHPALAIGRHGGELRWLDSGHASVLRHARERAGRRVVVDVDPGAAPVQGRPGWDCQVEST